LSGPDIHAGKPIEALHFTYLPRPVDDLTEAEVGDLLDASEGLICWTVGKTCIFQRRQRVDDPGIFAFQRNGIPLLNQSPFVERKHVEAAYGQRWLDFAQWIRTMDPNGRMLNPFFADLLPK
jgi:hypothetical protein